MFKMPSPLDRVRSSCAGMRVLPPIRIMLDDQPVDDPASRTLTMNDPRIDDHQDTAAKVQVEAVVHCRNGPADRRTTAGRSTTKCELCPQLLEVLTRKQEDLNDMEQRFQFVQDRYSKAQAVIEYFQQQQSTDQQILAEKERLEKRVADLEAYATRLEHLNDRIQERSQRRIQFLEEELERLSVTQGTSTTVPGGASSSDGSLTEPTVFIANSDTDDAAKENNDWLHGQQAKQEPFKVPHSSPRCDNVEKLSPNADPNSTIQTETAPLKTAGRDKNPIKM